MELVKNVDGVKLGVWLTLGLKLFYLSSLSEGPLLCSHDLLVAIMSGRQVICIMSVTINDIAELAGVAKSTVSRYLNGGNVGEKTKEKNGKGSEETNYETKWGAQSMKEKKRKVNRESVPKRE